MSDFDRPYLFRCGEPDSEAKSAAEWDHEYNQRADAPRQPSFPPEWMVCPGCIRFRFSPIHLYLRLVGTCDGRNAC